MRIFHPLRRGPVALLWTGLSLSAIGDQLYAVALSWVAVQVLGANAGYLSALQALVVLVAVLGIGRWADRWDQQRGMIGADLCRAAILLAVVLAWEMRGDPSAPDLVVAVVVLAVGQAVFQPALQAILPPLVDDSALLPAANALLDATDRSARLLGPGLVGLFAGLVPVVHFLTIDAVSFLASAAALTRIARRPGRIAAPRRKSAEGIRQSFGRGVRAMLGHPLLGFVLRVTGLLNGVWYAAFYLALPLMIERHGLTGPGGSGLGAFGLVISAYGLTNLAATIVFGSRTLPARPQFQMFSGNLIVGAGMVLLGFAAILPDRWMLPGLMAASAFAAIGGPMKDIPLAVLRQTRLRHADMAAAMRVYMAANSGGMLLAMLLAPALVAHVGAAPAAIGFGAIVVAIGVAGLALHAGHAEHDATEPAASV